MWRFVFINFEKLITCKFVGADGWAQITPPPCRRRRRRRPRAYYIIVYHIIRAYNIIIAHRRQNILFTAERPSVLDTVPGVDNPFRCGHLMYYIISNTNSRPRDKPKFTDEHDI